MLTREYQTMDEATTMATASTITADDVSAVTEVANTLVNKTIALGLVRVTRKPNRNGLREEKSDATGSTADKAACLLANRS